MNNNCCLRMLLTVLQKTTLCIKVVRGRQEDKKQKSTGFDVHISTVGFEYVTATSIMFKDRKKEAAAGFDVPAGLNVTAVVFLIRLFIEAERFDV
ncbi:hypothetical protein Tco_1030091 [Tanacetum coccineum]|uniref:Uncharacterized protein n=1 Tax=Tanacetum coccineum TaxID=301880 RepID=A0ABQ5G583_9ASTR